MQEDQTTVPQNTQTEPLRIINGIRFTYREFDIVACLLRGHNVQTTAVFLSISPRTVETHIRNVMRKLECNSQQGIRVFIEKSGSSSPLSAHYDNFRKENNFAKTLQEISRLRGKETPVCVLVCDNENKSIFRLARHLRLAGIKIQVKTRDKRKKASLIISTEPNQSDCIIYLISKSLLTRLGAYENEAHLEITQVIQRAKQNPGSVILLLEGNESSTEISPAIHDVGFINFSLEGNYYFPTFKLIKKILPSINIDELIEKFEKQNPDEGFKKQHFDEWQKPPLPTIKRILERSCKFLRRGYALLLITFFLCLFLSFYFFDGWRIAFREKKTEKPFQENIAEGTLSIRSDLALPSEITLLKRPELIAQIHEKLRKQHGVRTLALVGLGGAGKTTLAIQYAHSRTSPVVWEINAETKESLAASFERLAYVLSKTEEDKKALRELQNAKNIEEREQRIIFFVREKLKFFPNWLLIFDNLDKSIDAQKYFPCDSKSWGKGTVIITTRDSNITNNRYLNDVVHVEELKPKEKLDLFLKIMGNSSQNSLPLNQEERTKKFLDSIPPFPLDISIAAYYIKATNVPYERYREHLNEPNEEFSAVQEKILKESGDYTKTRYNIISLSLKRMTEDNKDFAELLLFMSLLDSQNIPRALLDTHKSEVVVDDFIYNLKKYSLITNGPLNSLQPLSVLSIHQSTQEIMLIYLKKSLNLKSEYHFLQDTTNTLEKFIADGIDGTKFLIIKSLVNHCKKFLSNANLLPDIMKTPIRIKLGEIYCFLSYYVEAERLLKQSIKSLDTNPQPIQRALALGYLGNVYRSLGEYKKAQALLEESLATYQKHSPQDHVGISWIHIYLGLVYRERGDYARSRHSFEESLAIYRTHVPEKDFGIARALGYLGYLYKEMGDFAKAKDALEKSLIIYKKHYFENPFRTAWILAYLGAFYNDLGEYEKANEMLEASKKIYKELHLDYHTDFAFALSFLGISYKGLGEYEKAKDILDQSLKIYRKLFPLNHLHTARTSMHLGAVYSNLGNHKLAKNLIKKSLEIYQKNYGKDHHKLAEVSRELGQVYLSEGNLEAAKNLLEESLETLHKNNHPHSYLSLESLAELFLKKSKLLRSKDDLQQAQIFKRRAVDYLNRALSVIKGSFPKDSHHIARIQTKLEKLENL